MCLLPRRYLLRTPPPILTPSVSLEKTTGRPPLATLVSHLPTPNRPLTNARAVNWQTNQPWWLKPNGIIPLSSVSPLLLEHPCFSWTSWPLLLSIIKKTSRGMRRTDVSQHHNVTALRVTHPLLLMTWPTSTVRNWCHCRWSNSSCSMSTTMSVSHYTPMIRCASRALLTTLSPCVGHLTTSPWWPPAPSPWSPIHWLACSPCTTSTLLVGARTVPTYPMAIPQHEYSSVVLGRCRISSGSTKRWRRRRRRRNWSTDSADVILLPCLLKKYIQYEMKIF